MSRDVVFARTSARRLAPVLLRLLGSGRRDRGGGDHGDSRGPCEAEVAVGDRDEPDACRERDPTGRDDESRPRVDRERDARHQHACERHDRESRHEHRLPEPRTCACRTAEEDDHSPDAEGHHDRAPARAPPETEPERVEGERSCPVRGVRPVDGRGGEEEHRLDGRHGNRRERTPEVDLAPGDGERGDLRGQGARGDGMGEREEGGADGVDRPPDDVAVVDRAREERTREKHRRQGERERVDRAREHHDADRGREDEGSGCPCVASRDAPSQTICGDRGQDDGDHRREAHPDLAVVPRHDRAQKREVAGACRVVGQCGVDDVAERAPRPGDRRRLVRVERAMTECDETEERREAGARVR